MYRSLKTLTILSVAALLLSASGCKKKVYDPMAGTEGGQTASKKQALPTGPGELRYVAAPSGLRMRDQPGLHGQKLMLVPFGTPVRVIKQGGKAIVVEGRRARWAQINRHNTIGWVFAGFLSKTPPAAK